MRRRLCRIAGTCVIAALFLASPSRGADNTVSGSLSDSGGPSPTETDDAALRALWAQMTDAWNRGDSIAIAAMFTESGDLIAGDGKRTVGRAEIARYFAGLLAALPKETRFIATVTSIRLLLPGVAIVSSSGGFLLPGDTEVTPERSGVQSLVAVQEGGAWHAALLQRTRLLRSATVPTK
jgi:uncharacterized protein (TIGR02246 family)